MGYSVGKFHGELDRVLHYQDALLIDSMQRAFGTYTWFDSEQSKGCFKVLRMAWDLGIEGFLHDQTMQRSMMTEWHIWDLGIIFGDSGDQQSDGALVQASLEDKQFLAGRTVISPILIFRIRDNFWKGRQFRHWDLGGKREIATLVEDGAHKRNFAQERNSPSWRREKEEGVRIRREKEWGPSRETRRPIIINNEKWPSFASFDNLTLNTSFLELFSQVNRC